MGFLVLALLLGGCPDPEDATQTTVRVGVLPDQSENAIRQRYGPLLRYLSETTGLTHELVVPRNYGHLLELFGENKVDLAYFGGFTFLKAQVAHGALPLVLRDSDTRFRSVFLSRAENRLRAVGDFKGLRFAFGSKLSTSGHLMPRHFLEDQEIEPEAFFAEVRYSGAHDRTAILVRDGEVDLGVANATIVGSMYEDGRLDEAEVRIVWVTPAYTDYVWAAQQNLKQEDREKILGAFLQLSPAEAVEAGILRQVGAGGFLPARNSDFDELRQVASALGLL